MLTSIVLSIVLVTSGQTISVIQNREEDGVRLVTYDLATGEELSLSPKLPIKEAGAVRTLYVAPNDVLAVVTKSTSALDPPPCLVVFVPKSGAHVMTDLAGGFVDRRSDFEWLDGSTLAWKSHEHSKVTTLIFPWQHTISMSKNQLISSGAKPLGSNEQMEFQMQGKFAEEAERAAWDMDWEYTLLESAGIVEFRPGIYGMRYESGTGGAVADNGKTFACYDEVISRQEEGASINTYWSGREKNIALDIGYMIAIYVSIQDQYFVITLARRNEFVVDKIVMGHRYASDMLASKVQVYSLESGLKVFEADGSAAYIN